MIPKVVVTGAGGKMGMQVIKAILAGGAMTIHSALDKADHPLYQGGIGHLVGATEGFFLRDVEESLSSALIDADVVIDFTNPEAAMNIIQQASENATAVVTGTTGFTPEQLERIREFSKLIPIVQSYNFSIGVNLLLRTIEEYAFALDEDFDIEIFEIHHKLKKDAPSGTAIKMAEAAAAGRSEELKDVAMYARHGLIGARTRGEIGIQALRVGDVVGEHTIIFGAPSERIELTHKAASREVFARGAVRAAQWLIGEKWEDGKEPGLYTMSNVLGMK